MVEHTADSIRILSNQQQQNKNTIQCVVDYWPNALNAAHIQNKTKKLMNTQNAWYRTDTIIELNKND